MSPSPLFKSARHLRYEKKRRPGGHRYARAGARRYNRTGAKTDRRCIGRRYLEQGIPDGSHNAVDGATPPRFGEVKIRNRGRLPHWEKEAGVYFVTFRLADSLPQHVLEKIVERQRVLRTAQSSGLKLSAGQEMQIADYSPKKIEEYLDAGKGACYLRDARIAKLVADTLRCWDGKRYRLIAWCVMPNHVPVVFRIAPGHELASILQRWKTYTAKMANQLLGRTGVFWQREYYDRLIRDGEELERAGRYVVSNPEKAGLKDWPWVWRA